MRLRVSPAFILPVCLFLGHPAWADDTSSNLDLTPQAEFVSCQEVQAERGLLLGRYKYESDKFIFSAEAFAIGDIAPGNAPDVRMDRNLFALQEAFFEVRPGGNFSVRVGRQPVRWSESWVVPSLDIWTARRWNELFYLPTPYQLINPTGILMSYDTSDTGVHLFYDLVPVDDIYPQGFSSPVPQKEGTEFGAKITQRVAGFDLGVVAAQQRLRNVLGATASYALDWAVPKIEVGGDDQSDRFGSAGMDIFLDKWSFHPQVTVYQSDLSLFNYERVLFLPIVFSGDANTFELETYGNLETYEQFYSLLYTHTFPAGFQVTGYVQNYEGDDGTLFGFYQSMIKSTVFGLRIGSTFAL